MIISVRSVRYFVFLGAAILAPLMSNCVCVAPRFNPNITSSCRSNSDCTSGLSCVAGRCSTTSGFCTSGIKRSCFISNKSDCAFGEEFCKNGRWSSTCIPTKIGAGEEICDGKDNDCDGQTDESFPEKGKSCVVVGARGPCAKGTYFACLNRNLLCTASTKPRPEGPSSFNCSDGIDNDCDGFIDDPDKDGCSKCKTGETQSCYPYNQGVKDPTVGTGPCKIGSRTCVNGSWQACKGAVVPSPERCGDNLDNDCDGKVDNHCSKKCDPIGSRQPCYNGPVGTKNVGICLSGVQTCLDRGEWGTCAGEVGPAKEVCGDKLDNDCNGKIDDCGSHQDCTPNSSRACFTGDPKTKGIGACQSGKESCSVQGKWDGQCIGQVVASREVCGNAKDDDCNGKVDDCQQSSEFVSASWDRSNALRLWDSVQGKAIRSFPKIHTDTIYTAVFSGTGVVLYTTSHDKSVVARDVATGKMLWKVADHTDAVHALAVDPKGRWLATGSADSTIRLRSPATGKTTQILKGHTGAVYALAVDPKGLWLISGSADTTVRLWDLSVTPAKTIRIFKGHSLEVFSVAFHPKGSMIASGSRDSSVILWDPQTGGQIQTLSKHSKSVTSLAFSTDGKWLASGGADAKTVLWDVSGKSAKYLRDLTKAGSGAIYALTFHPVKHTLYSGHYNGSIIVWDASSGKELQSYPAHTSPVSALSFRP